VQDEKMARGLALLFKVPNLLSGRRISGHDKNIEKIKEIGITV